MQYRKSTKEEASLTATDKVHFLSSTLAFFVVLFLVRTLKNINRFLPAILIAITGIATALLASSVVIKNKHDKEDGITHGFHIIPAFAYVALVVVSFLLLFITMLAFAETVRHGKLNT